MQLSNTERAFLQLAATKPLADLTEFHLDIAKKLAKLGLLVEDNGRWYPTAAGLQALAQTLH